MGILQLGPRLSRREKGGGNCASRLEREKRWENRACGRDSGEQRAATMMKPTGHGPMSGVELWGGFECTVNRVGNSWFNQLERSGHLSRIGDLEQVAALGIRTLRYPVLWELIAPESP